MDGWLLHQQRDMAAPSGVWQFMEKEKHQETVPQALLRLKSFEESGSEQESPIELWNYSREALIELVHALEKKT